VKTAGGADPNPNRPVTHGEGFDPLSLAHMNVYRQRIEATQLPASVVSSSLLFSSVIFSDSKFHDLEGNVAEWVTGPGGPCVIGGSALSNQDPGTPVSSDANSKFTDVGFRLALDLPPPKVSGTIPQPSFFPP
jgi:hypothetical protein